MHLKPIDRKAASTLDSSWTKNISYELLPNKIHRVSLIIFASLLFLILILSFHIYICNTAEIIAQDTESQLLQNLQLAHDTLQSHLNAKFNSLKETGNIVVSENGNSEKQLVFLKNACKSTGFSSIWIANKNGVCYFEDGSIGNIENQDYFSNALNNISSITANQPHPISGKQSIIFTAPIYENNELSSVICGAMSISYLSDIILDINVYNRSQSFVMKKNGDLVSKTSKLHFNQYTNLFTYLEKQKIDYQTFAANINSEKSGTQLIQYSNNESYIFSYTPLEQTEDFILVNVILTDETMTLPNKIIKNTSIFIAVAAAMLLIALLYIHYLKHSSKKTFHYLACTDQLTGCRSWAKFALDAKELLKKSKDKQYTYIYSNIVNFKYVNDIMDFSVGNQLLQHISKVLEMNLNTDEPYTRINADRFSFLMEYVNNETTIRRLEKISKEVMAFQSNYKLNFLTRMDFGIYKIKDTSLPITTMSDRALLAMQSINGSKDTFYSFYNSKIREKALLQKEFEGEMEDALTQNQFEIHLQPKFSLSDKSIIGAEALVRWNHPQRGLILPSQFISLFEANGFIVKLDYYVFEETCRLLRRWIQNGMQPVPISVNMSRTHIYNPLFAQELHSIVEKYHIPMNLIEIELTETMNLENISSLLNAVRSLKEYRFILSIDDFGTGYSSLNLLKNLPVDILKLDREFFSQAADEQRGRQVIASIIDMAKRLDMKTVAEGVELQEQAEFLSSVNCDFVQGYYFSKPITISNFESNYIHKLK